MNKTQMYKPEPFENSSIQLPEELLARLEILAKNVHEEWALRRMNEGWKYGPSLDETNKIHPSLAPYDDLPEDEKEYDRQTALSTIKMVISMGFKLS